MFELVRTLFLTFFEKAGPKHDEDPSNKISKVLDMYFISIKNMKWKFGNMYQISFENIKRVLKPRNQNQKPTLFIFGDTKTPQKILEICGNILENIIFGNMRLKMFEHFRTCVYLSF